MQALSLRHWLQEAWQRKESLLGGFIAFASLLLAHYAGFLLTTPLTIVAVAGLPLAPGVTATFFFYVMFCAVVARVITSIILLSVLPFLAISDWDPWLRKKMEFSRQRRFVRSHSQTMRWEGPLWGAVQIVIFLALMLALYVKFAVTWLSGAGLFAAFILVLLSSLVRSGFVLQPKPTVFARKLRTRARYLSRAASATFATGTAALVVGAFVMGSMRMTLLREQAPQTTVTSQFNGKANVLASSEGALLLFQKQGDAVRYIYSTREFTTAIETGEAAFPPIGK